MEPVDRFLSKLTSSVGNQERVREILLDCIQHLIIKPRFNMISILDVLTDKMIENKYDEKLIQDFRNEYRQFFMSVKNKNFTKLYYVKNNEDTEIKIPPYLKKIFKNYFNESIDLLIKKIIDRDDVEIIRELTDNYIKEWRSPTQLKEYIRNKAPSAQEENYDNYDFRRGRQESGYVNGETSIDMQEGTEIDQRTYEKLKKQQEIINLKYKKGFSEIKKEDKERFENIFEEMGIKNENIKNTIKKIWYGDINSNDLDANNILNIIKKKKIKSKISNHNIKSSTSRLILQTYIAGLITGKNIYEIFTTVNRIDNNVSPDMIYSKGKPNIKIQDILNNVISEIYLEPNSDEINLRTNWEKIKNPIINIEKLIKYIENFTQIHETNRYLIISRIKELNPKTSLEKFTKSVHEIIKKISVKNITEANIMNNIKYY